MSDDQHMLDIMYLIARTHNGWLNKPVDDALLQQAYDLAKWGPTSTNCCPMRIVFIKSKEAKEKLLPCLSPGNTDKTMLAPVTALIGYDMEFYKKLPFLSPKNNAITWFEGKTDLIDITAKRNGTLQAGYFLLAARAVGLDCGPMSGFDTAKADTAFFAGTAIKSNFLCNLGYGDVSKLYPRGPRMDFDEVCKLV